MAEGNFGIICDEGCDLPAAFLERAGVVCASLGEKNPGPTRADGHAGASGTADGSAVTVADMAPVLEACYRALAARGVTEVVSVHSAGCFSPAVEAARQAAAACADELRVEVVDSGSGSAATGMLLDRASFYRSRGADLDAATAALSELASHARLLVVPATSAPLVRRRARRAHAGLLSRATASLRVRISGERGLYLVTRGEVTQLARSTDLAELTGRLAHAMSAVAANEGPLTYVLVETGDSRSLRMLEKPLDTNEFDARRLGTVRAGVSVGQAVGAGAVAVALVPTIAYDRLPGDEGTAEDLADVLAAAEAGVPEDATA